LLQFIVLFKILLSVLSDEPCLQRENEEKHIIVTLLD